MTVEWPPVVGARVQNAAGDELVVTARHWNPTLGDFVVVKRTFPGGWECRPLTRAEWSRGHYRRVR